MPRDTIMNEDFARKALERALAEYDRTSGGFFLERFFGCQLSFDGDTCVLGLEIEDFMFNSAGKLHGGAIAFVLDSAAGSLFKSVHGSGYTLEAKIQYLRPLGRGHATCKARFLKRGRLVSFVEAVLSGPDGKPAAIATSTWHSA
jgi:uncharacterized protein (TIGR00369 family)